MTHLEIIFTIIIITLFCLGLRTLFSEGMILHFIRKPFEMDDSEIMFYLREKLRDKTLDSTFNQNDLPVLKKRYKVISQDLKWFLKPIILCVICYSSFWGSTIFIILHPIQYSLHYLFELLISCISSAFLIKIIYDKTTF